MNRPSAYEITKTNLYTTVAANSASWGTGGSPQSLTFNESTAALSISNGNTVSLSALSGSSAQSNVNLSEVSAASASWNAAYTVTRAQSSNNASVYSTVNSNSAAWNADADNQTLSFNSSNAVLTISSGNSVSLSALSATSAPSVNLSEVSAASAKWNSTYATVNAQSASNTSVYATVNANSAAWAINTDNQTLSFNSSNAVLTISSGNSISLSALSSQPVNLSDVSSNSAKWNSAYSTVNANSTQWAINTDAQTLSFNNATAVLTISNGNSVSLSALSATNASSVDLSEVSAASGKWNSTYTTVNAQSASNASVYSVVNANSAAWAISTDAQTLSFDDTTAALTISNGNTVSLSSLQGGNSAAPVNLSEVAAASSSWNSTYATVLANSASWNADADNQTISFNESAATLSISNGNTISLSALSSQPTNLSDVIANSAKWNSAYSTTNAQSASNASVYSVVNANSAAWDINTDAQTLSFNAATIILTISGGNSVSLSALSSAPVNLTDVSSNSAKWNSAYSTVNANSTQWAVNTDAQTLSYNSATAVLTISSGNSVSLSALSSTPVNLTDVTANSGKWNSAYSTVNANSTQWAVNTDAQTLSYNSATAVLTISNGNSVSLSALSSAPVNLSEIAAASGKWNSAYTTINSQSASNVSVYTTVNANSATWGSGGGGGNTAVDTLVMNTSASWNSAYSTVNTNSATWSGGGGGGSYNWELLSTTTISSAVASVNVIGLSGHSRYMLDFRDIVPVLNGYILQMRMSSDNGATFYTGASDYSWCYSGYGIYFPTRVTESYCRLTYLTKNVAGNGANGKIFFFDPNDASTPTTYMSDFLETVFSSNDMQGLKGGGKIIASNVTNALQFYFSTGNIASGVIKVYGWNE